MVGSPLTLGAFMPLPLAMMIPFMATQSLVMGEAFGKSYQYGKRKISAMTNEEFNKVDLTSLMMEQTSAIQKMLPELRQQLADSEQLQRYIVDAMVKLVPSIITQIGESVGGLLGFDGESQPATISDTQPGGDRRAGPTVEPTGITVPTQVPNPESRREQTTVTHAEDRPIDQTYNTQQHWIKESQRTYDGIIANWFKRLHGINTVSNTATAQREYQTFAKSRILFYSKLLGQLSANHQSKYHSNYNYVNKTHVAR